MFINSLYGCFKKGVRKTNLEDIYRNEVNPKLYISNLKAIRRNRLEGVIGGILLATIAMLGVILVQVAYGIW